MQELPASLRRDRLQQLAASRDRLVWAAAAVVAVAAIVAVVEYPRALGKLQDRAAANAAVPAAERELAGAYAIDISRSFLRAADRILPRTDTFAVWTGPDVRVSTPVTLLGVADYAQFWLLPRRETDTEHARWLLCYGCKRRNFPYPLRTAWSDGGGISIERIVR